MNLKPKNSPFASIAFAAYTTALAIALTTANPTPSLASLSQCSPGTTCGWNSNNYSGRYMKAFAKVDSYKSIRWNDDQENGPNDAFNSVANSGKSCDVVFWKDAHQSGDAIRFNRPSKGGTTRDPYLKNGGGYSYTNGASSKNWQNQISSHSWVNCK